MIQRGNVKVNDNGAQRTRHDNVSRFYIVVLNARLVDTGEAGKEGLPVFNDETNSQLERRNTNRSAGLRESKLCNCTPS